MNGRRLGLLLLGTGLIAGGCASGGATVVDARELGSADGRPQLEEIKDLGGWDIPAVGQVRDRPSDGVLTIGETLWIRGDELGRQPTVLIGGRPAAVVSRSADGGVLVRVPPGTPAGEQALSVTHREGEASQPVRVRRIGGVVGGGRVTWFAAEGEGAHLLGSAALVGASSLAISGDGRAAYVFARDGIHIFELPAPRIPLEVGRLAAEAPVRAVLAASDAPTLLVVSDHAIARYDTRWPLRPVAAGQMALPAGVVVAVGAPMALSADGTRLAVALTRPNRVVVLSMARPELGERAEVSAAEKQPGVGVTAEILPEVRAPVINGLAFSPAGDTLWVVSGSNPQNQVLGPMPTLIHILQVERQLALHRRFEVAGVRAPTAISVSHPGLASGSSIRFPPEQATVHLAAMASALEKPAVFAVAPGQAARPLVVAAGEALGRSGLSPDGHWLFAAVVDGPGAARLVAASLEAPDVAPTTLDLAGLYSAPGSGEGAAPPVVLQP